MISIILLFASAMVLPSIPGPILPPTHPARDDIRGTYLLEPGGTVVSIYDLHDYMPDDSHQLTLMEPASGRIRTLHPADDSGVSWVAGPAWFESEPVEIRIRATGLEGSGAGALEWVEGEDTLLARRVLFPSQPIRVAGGPVPLRGTLILPPGSKTRATDGPGLPAIVMVHGSGAATREVPRSIGELFALAGVAAVVFDKRGTGESGGEFSTATVADFATDAARVVSAAAAHPATDSTRIGVLVASQGGLLVPRIVEANPEVALLVCRACPVLPGGETSIAEARGRLALAGLPDSAADSAATLLRAQQRYALTREGYDRYASLVAESRGTRWAEVILPNLSSPMPPHAAGWRYYRDFITPDPWATYRNFRGPVLGIFGALDERIPRELHAEPFGKLLARTGHPASEVWVLENATHGLMVVEAHGSRQGPFRRMPPGWLDRMVAWVVEQLGGAA